MAGELYIRDREGALNWAHRFATATGQLDQLIAEGVALVEGARGASPLFGDDRGGRRGRQDHDEVADQLMEALRRLGEVCSTFGPETKQAIDRLIEAEERNRRAFN